MGGMKKGASSTPFDEEEENGENVATDDEAKDPETDGHTTEVETTNSQAEEPIATTGDESGMKEDNPVSNGQADDTEADSGVESIDTPEEVATLSPDAVDPTALALEYVPDDYQHKGSDLEIKWALGRQNVRKSRDKQKMFLLQNSIDDLEEEIVDKLTEEEEVSDVNITDVREAALILAYNQPEKLAELLDGWGARHV